VSEALNWMRKALGGGDDETLRAALWQNAQVQRAEAAWRAFPGGSFGRIPMRCLGVFREFEVCVGNRLSHPHPREVVLAVRRRDGSPELGWVSGLVPWALQERSKRAQGRVQEDAPFGEREAGEIDAAIDARLAMDEVTRVVTVEQEEWATRVSAVLREWQGGGAAFRERFLQTVLDEAPLVRSRYGLYGYPPMWKLCECEGIEVMGAPRRTMRRGERGDHVETDGIAVGFRKDGEWVDQEYGIALGDETPGAIAKVASVVLHRLYGGAPEARQKSASSALKVAAC
jgi:hypothetical protein